MILLPTSKIKSRRKSRKVDWTWSWRRSLVDDLYSFSIIFLFAMFRFHVSLLSNCNDGYFLFKMMSSILCQRDVNFLTSIGTLCTDITLPCKSRHHAFRWLTHAVVFSRCIMDTQAWFFHQPFGACFFFFGQLIEAAGSPWEAIAPLSGPQNPWNLIIYLFVVVSKKNAHLQKQESLTFCYFHPFSPGEIVPCLDATQGCSWQDGLGSSGAVEHTSAICFWCKCGLEA